MRKLEISLPSLRDYNQDEKGRNGDRAHLLWLSAKRTRVSPLCSSLSLCGQKMNCINDNEQSNSQKARVSFASIVIWFKNETRTSESRRSPMHCASSKCLVASPKVLPEISDTLQMPNKMEANTVETFTLDAVYCFP